MEPLQGTNHSTPSQVGYLLLQRLSCTSPSVQAGDGSARSSAPV